MPAAIFEGIAPNEQPESNAFLSLDTAVDHSWLDYNGHMTEWQYYKALADASENFLREIGFTEEYRLQGYSFFSVEGHLRNLRECLHGAHLKVFSAVVGYDSFRLHIYQYVLDCDRDIVVATGEHLLIHVDTHRRRATATALEMPGLLDTALAKRRPKLKPKGLGRAITMHPPGHQFQHHAQAIPN